MKRSFCAWLHIFVQRRAPVGKHAGEEREELCEMRKRVELDFSQATFFIFYRIPRRTELTGEEQSGSVALPTPPPRPPRLPRALALEKQQTPSTRKHLESARMVARGAPPRSSALFPLLLLASAAHAASPLPPIDFSSLGTVGVLGSFAGLQLVDPFSRTPSYNPAAATVVARAPNGSLTNLGETNPGGRISALCQAPSGTVYVGGLFTSVGGVAAVNVAQYTPSSAVFSALGEGVNGEVLALSCNGTTVYAGGAFASPVGGTPATYGGNVAAWTTNSSTWSPLPFVGLNGLVRSISPSSDGRSIFFGGAFSTTFSNSTSALSTSVTTRIPSLGSSLTPLSLNTSEYVASPTSYISGFGRPQHVFCPRRGDGVGSSWLLVDNQAGYFISRLFRPLNAGGVRLGNTFYEGRGTANFSSVFSRRSSSCIS